MELIAQSTTQVPYNYEEIEKYRLEGKSWETIGSYYNRHFSNTRLWYKRQRDSRIESQEKYKRTNIAQLRNLEQLQSLDAPLQTLITTTTHTPNDTIYTNENDLAQLRNQTLDASMQASIDANLNRHRTQFLAIKKTKHWSWKHWAKVFLNKDLFEWQIDILKSLDKEPCIITIARQHGKSSFILLTFILRKLCESVFDYLEGSMNPILYVSASTSNCTAMMSNVREELMSNEAIIAWYGMLVDRQRVEGLVLAPNTAKELRLITRTDRYLKNMATTTPSSSVRGGNYAYVLIDDGVDYKQSLTNPSKTAKETTELLSWYRLKIIPLIKKNAAFVGTRYSPSDIYQKIYDTRSFTWHNYPAIDKMPEYTLPDIDTTNIKALSPKDIIVSKGKYKLLSPEIFEKEDNNFFYNGTPIQNLIFKRTQGDELSFNQEYLCEPITITNQFDSELMRRYTVLPKEYHNMKWVVFCDAASGKTEKSDVTSIVAVAVGKDKQFYIHDMIYGRWTGKEKQERTEEFVKDLSLRLKINVDKLPYVLEVVRNQDYYNRLKDESWLRPIKVNPRERGKKEERISHGFGVDLDNGKINLNENSRSIDRLNTEIRGFGAIHMDVVDAVDQAMHWLRRFGRKSTIEAF